MAARRRLSAVLHADLSGFARLMEAGEERTVSRLKSVHSEIWRPAIGAGGGTVVDMVGDSALAEFGSAMAAVATAIDIQERMARFNAPLDERQRFLFRIGLHLGEIIVDEDTSTIYGDGVNVAARIQALARPGGIALSRAVFDVTEVSGGHAFVDGGQHAVKNLSRPIHIYHVQLERDATDTTTSATPQTILQFRGADRGGRRFAFEVGVDMLIGERAGMVIGRDFEQCLIVLSHGTVSRRHARLELVDGVITIEDLGSSNGTWVDDTAALPGKRHSLQVGSRLRLGEIELAVDRA